MTLVMTAGGLWAEQLSARNNVRARRSKRIERTRDRARDDNLLFVRDTWRTKEPCTKYVPCERKEKHQGAFPRAANHV